MATVLLVLVLVLELVLVLPSSQPRGKLGLYVAQRAAKRKAVAKRPATRAAVAPWPAERVAGVWGFGACRCLGGFAAAGAGAGGSGGGGRWRRFSPTHGGGNHRDSQHDLVSYTHR